MSVHTSRTARINLSDTHILLFNSFSEYLTSQGETHIRATISSASDRLIEASVDLVRYEWAFVVEDRALARELELTGTGRRAWLDTLAGVRSFTVTTGSARSGQPVTAHDPVARRIEALGMFVEHYDADGALSYRLLGTPNARMLQEIDRLRRDGLTVHHYDRHSGWAGQILTRPHGMRMRHELIGEPEGQPARSRRGTETPAHMQRYQLTETDVSILERFIPIPTRNGLTVCRYSVPFDQTATIRPMLNLMRLGLVGVIEVTGSHHVLELTETGHYIRELTRRNPGSPVLVAEPGEVQFTPMEEEAKPTPPQSATQPQRRLRNSRKKG